VEGKRRGKEEQQPFCCLSTSSLFSIKGKKREKKRGGRRKGRGIKKCIRRRS